MRCPSLDLPLAGPGQPATTVETTAGFAPSGEPLWRAYPDGDAVGSATTPWTYDSLGRLNAVPASSPPRPTRPTG